MSLGVIIMVGDTMKRRIEVSNGLFSRIVNLTDGTCSIETIISIAIARVELDKAEELLKRLKGKGEINGV